MSLSPVAIRPLLLKPQWMNGLSERLLVSHYENNYGGALQRLNAIRARLAALDWTHTPPFEINRLKREELIAAGSVILHEIYFDSLGGHGDNPPAGLAEPPAGLAQALERDFGSVAAWRVEFTAMAKAQRGGSGWTILAWSERLGSLVNQWQQTTRTACRALRRSSRSTCTSMPIISILARKQRPMWIR
jgi:Fe-Mn family superoxide dismutase